MEKDGNTSLAEILNSPFVYFFGRRRNRTLDANNPCICHFSNAIVSRKSPTEDPLSRC